MQKLFGVEVLTFLAAFTLLGDGEKLLKTFSLVSGCSRNSLNESLRRSETFFEQQQTSPSNLTSANELKSSIVINLRCALHSGRQSSAKKFARMMDSLSVVCRSEIAFFARCARIFLLFKKFNLRLEMFYRCVAAGEQMRLPHPGKS